MALVARPLKVSVQRIAIPLISTNLPFPQGQEKAPSNVCGLKHAIVSTSAMALGSLAYAGAALYAATFAMVGD